MSNGLRHFLGLVFGILVTPVLAAGLAWAPNWAAGIGLDYDLTAVPGVPGWVVPVAVLAVLGLVLGLVTGSRLSPLAALVPGLLMAAAGAVETAALPLPVPGLRELLNGGTGAEPWFSWGPVFLLAGAALIFSALAPSRWRRRVHHGEDAYEGPYEGYDDYEGAYGDYPPPGYDPGADALRRAAPAEPARGTAAAEDTESTRTMSWDADGMPPRYHVPDTTGPQQSAGWNEPRRADRPAPGEEPGHSRPPRWEDRGTGP